ncbi:sensor histidine kinase [Companilactobacillus ginsenosidimutans]|uniref:histidine kinase n=1 Tax=Companilactobacillus ginsenosidimutans TaxID=1007676 RepID=A0A0H4QH62_9LACO|nr:sensor histidine kinase [Companilactobacillus ginsenosidimutans]AKP67754.1 hypothetical protein ABM34_09580 [Companilactobacillus ginsenosidimutans]
MKQFLYKHFLFDKSYGLMGYFWLIALALFSVPIVIAIHDFPKWIAIVLLLIYAKFYRDSYYDDKFQIIKVLTQLCIVGIISDTAGNGTLYIFMAWQLGSMTISTKKFYWFTGLYLLITVSSLTFSLSLNNGLSIYDYLLALFFAIGSPFAARSLKNTYRRRSQLSQNNARLETVIKQAERSRIAKDLHDTLGQSFSIITLKAELAEKLMSKDQAKASQELQDIAMTSRENLNVVRQIVADLNKQTIAEAMVIEEKNLKAASIFMQSQNENISSNWPDNVQNTLAGIIKESVTNIIRYSKANLAIFSFNQSKDSYLLEIKDNGTGIQTNRDNSFGIKGMQQSVRAMGGTINLQNNNGTVINISLPKED